ncbi:hypothetical protein WBG83_18745 [Paenibacillus sp. y28]
MFTHIALTERPAAPVTAPSRAGLMMRLGQERLVCPVKQRYAGSPWQKARFDLRLHEQAGELAAASRADVSPSLRRA